MDGEVWWAAVHGVTKSWTQLSDFPFTFHFHALEKEMATHSSVLAWRIPGTEEPGGLLSLGLHRIGHNWSDLACTQALIVFSLNPSVSVSLVTIDFWRGAKSYYFLNLFAFIFFFISIYAYLFYSHLTWRTDLLYHIKRWRWTENDNARLRYTCCVVR